MSRPAEYIRTWTVRDYPEDIPDEVPTVLMNLGLAPSYKAIALAILRNDMQFTSLGFASRKSGWYSVLKHIEIRNRGDNHVAKAKKDDKPALVPAFYLNVDGKQYGPFSTKHETELKRLYHYKGVEPRYVSLPKDQLLAPPKKAKVKVQEPSLLENVDWLPLARVKRFD